MTFDSPFLPLSSARLPVIKADDGEVDNAESYDREVESYEVRHLLPVLRVFALLAQIEDGSALGLPERQGQIDYADFLPHRPKYH